MKNIITIALLAAGLNLNGQQVEIPIPFSSPEKPKMLDIQLFSGEIHIKGTNRNDVLVKYEIEEKDNLAHVKGQNDLSEKTDGMKKIGGGNFNFELGERNNKVKLETANWHNYIKLEIEVPTNIDINIQKQIGQDITIEKINGDVNVENNVGSLTMAHVSGIVNASSSTGDIIVTFDEIDADKVMSFNTLTGNIDLTLPKSYNANLKMRTEWGEIYSDLNVKTKPIDDSALKKVDTNGGMKVISNNWTYGTLNSGGPELTLKTQMGSIYLRAKE